MFNRILLCVIITIGACTSAICINKSTKTLENTQQKEQIKPKSPEINEYFFGYQSYKEISETFKNWEQEASDLVEIGTYGKTTKGEDHYYLKISNEYSPGNEIVLITACIHGNEPWSTSVIMSYAGKLLSSYGKDETLTKLIDSRVIYFIPVVSPDSYPFSRSVDGVDPNRNFPTLKEPEKISVIPIKNLQDFFLKIKPDSVLSGHTYGRVFLIPWGDSTKNNPNISDYERIASSMSKLSGYKYQRACEMYNKPIYGTETDWYHRHKAFAMVMEFGSHQRKPSLEETKSEFNKTFEAFIYFIQESVNVNIQN